MALSGQLIGLSAALLYVCLLAVIYALRDRRALFRILSGRKACVISISITLFLLLVFGLVPQDGGRSGFFGVLGFRSMSRSPIFILALLFLSTTVTLNTIENIRHFSRHRLGVTCAHLGLSVILISGLFGGAGNSRARMTASPDIPVHSGTDERTGGSRKLPFELTLRSFDVNEYASEVTVTFPDGRSGETTIAVNHPAKVGSWWIYQTDYRMDTENGTFVSIFKCVHSPLSGVIRVALWLLLVSAAAMVFFAGFKPCFRKRETLSEGKSKPENGEADGIFKCAQESRRDSGLNRDVTADGIFKKGERR